MSMLAFLPWLQITTHQNAAEFQLVPFQRGLAPAGQGTPEQDILDGVLAPYHAGGAPIAYATLIQTTGGNLTRDLSDEERGALFIFSELLSVAGLSARELFGPGGMGYRNRDSFRLVIQGFSDDHHGTAITTRRRDGSTTNYLTEDDYHVQKPEHIPLPHGNTALDFKLLEPLLDYRESKDWEAIYEAILGFNLANTDSSDISEHIEAVLLVSALERLFECPHGKEDDLAKHFSASVKPTETIDPNTVFTSSQTLKFKKSKSVRDMWIRDFFRLRGNLAHGKIESKYPPEWSLRNHLLLGSFVFPLALKLKLQASNVYQLTEHDCEAIDMFEKQLLHDHFAPVENRHNHSAYPWNRVKDEADQRRLGWSEKDFF
ncbi:hypothetical protein SAMN04244573_00817 [Azotobacter beijerinckii]|uniref:Apea-like HEPN domain-containing protein n=1 Tax=Azotobacter beijerinckii TaxID=170623 RepID=A0A1H9CE76_9GAMM|nr:hypothetical protein [Azotobacter beijerinckii]SEP99307.1 hypothetical protein SAMN04244573_00817 [Azotobacter beijerinckii]